MRLMVYSMLKMNKFTVIGITATIILTFFAGSTGFFEFVFSNYVKIRIFYLSFYLSSTVLMLGICLGILSTFAKRKRKILFYSSIITIILGQIVGAVILGYHNPGKIGLNLELPPHGIAFLYILCHNLMVSLIGILAGPIIVYPYILLATVTSQLDFIAGTIFFHGFEGVILFLGAFHIYPELYAAYLACISGIRVSLKSFEAYISIRQNGFKNTLKTIKDVMIYELKNTMPKVVILLIIAALLQDLWAPFWTMYWLQHIA